MTESSQMRYYLGVFTSLISVLGWVGAPLFLLYSLYLWVTGGPAEILALLAVGSLVVGIVFARVERYFYPHGYWD